MTILRYITFTIFIFCTVNVSHAQDKYQTLFEATHGNETPEYHDVIAYFEKLARDFEDLSILEFGETDAGFPLHVILFDQKRDFDPKLWHEQERLIMLINNGIHPGEPDGIDASMLFLRDVLLGKIEVSKNLAIALVPVYNIGGHLNRGAHSRVNQNGPLAYGFRGNGRNYDLNRDFIKADTKNAKSFQELFTWIRPQVFIDTHVSNGADYQHVMTLISTQHDRLGGKLGAYLENELNPALYAQMESKKFPMIPYVNAWGGKPEDGWPQFKDNGRYSSGFAALFGTLSFMPETHMLKPYKVRVASTYAFFEAFVALMQAHEQKVVDFAKSDRQDQKSQKTFALNHVSDKTDFKSMKFLGFESDQKKSEVSGFPRLYYDRSKPFVKEIKFFDSYKPGLSIEKPEAYIIPQAWTTVVENLQRNGVLVERLESDSLIHVTTYHIKDFQTAPRPYEGHYLHTAIQVEKNQDQIRFRKGDFLVEMNQETNRYIIEVLEPEGEDSFFAWNFFDTILQAKEGYSAYVFEDLAAEYLETHPAIRKMLEEAIQSDEKLAESGAAQLRWVYEHSPWKEKEHNLYPIYRVE